MELTRITAAWLDDLADWKIALTLTFKPYLNSGIPLSELNVKKTTCFLIKRINKHCFGHMVSRKNYHVASVFAIEFGYAGERPHVHATLSLPPNYSAESFAKVILKHARNIRSINQQIDIQPYRNSGWHEYSLKTGLEHLAAEEICGANPNR